jgi:HlyD family secretion protein
VATEQLDTARSAADRTRAEAAAARAQIERAAAAVRLTEQEIENLRVRAPFDGVVAEVLTELGESVVPGAPLIEILDPDALYVSAEIDEVDIGRVQVGLAVLIELDPFPGVEFHGTVTRVAPYVSDLLEQNRTLEVEIDFETPAELPDPRPGTSADVEIILERRDDVMRVPTFSVIEGDHVLVVEAGRARARRVTTGLRNWDFTEIVDGLRGGERVITSLDRVQLEPGMRVEAEGSTGTDRGQ